jgi:hypothetical protein
MPIPGEKNAMADGPASTPKAAQRKRRLVGHPLLRALHRDVGYLAVGLTCVYALSGLAVNHVKDRDPSFEDYERVHRIAPLPGLSDEVTTQRVLAALHIDETPRDVYRSGDDALSITFDKRSLHVTPSRGEVLEQGQEPRFFLRAANYLHLNRGKRAWTWVADSYAIGLLGLALSGMFMLPGRRGFFGRGFFLVLLGAAVPILYVTLSG